MGRPLILANLKNLEFIVLDISELSWQVYLLLCDFVLCSKLVFFLNAELVIVLTDSTVARSRLPFIGAPVKVAWAEIKSPPSE